MGGCEYENSLLRICNHSSSCRSRERPSIRPAGHRRFGVAQCHDHNRQQTTSAAASKFRWVIKEKASESTPWWPPRVVPPKGAPNVLLIMTGTFGGVIPTPAMDRIAQAGLRYTNFHSTSLCSPTRAAIITGRNHHSVGFGVVGEIAT